MMISFCPHKNAFIYSTNKYLLSTYHEPNTVLGAGDVDGDRRGKVLDLWNLSSSGEGDEETDNNQVNG